MEWKGGKVEGCIQDLLRVEDLLEEHPLKLEKIIAII